MLWLKNVWFVATRETMCLVGYPGKAGRLRLVLNKIKKTKH